MCMTDPIADLLTRMRNALRIEAKTVVAPYSKLKNNILTVLKDSGYINDFTSEMQDGHAVLKIDLKYGPDDEFVIQHIQRVSKPGCRVYRGVNDLPTPLNGLGIAVVSTPKGVMTHAEAKAQKVGGEIICEVW